MIVVGLGKSGLAASKLLKDVFHFQPQNLKTYDESATTVADFCRPQDALDFDADFLILSPGYPRSTKWVQQFLSSKGVDHLYSEVDVGLMALRNQKRLKAPPKIIGITGSAGKSTASVLLDFSLRAEGFDVYLGGNFGPTVCEYSRDVILGERSEADYLVLELSSYQLESLSESLDISMITSFSPNHLDRYKSLEDYYQTKANIISLTKDRVFVNSSCEALVSWIEKQQNPVSQKILFSNHRPWYGQKILGKHNEQNLDLVADVLTCLKTSTKAFEALIEFPGLPHRLENVGYYNGILFINDSKATTIDSVLMAVDSVSQASTGAVHLLLGGKDKDLPWEQLSALKQKSLVKAYFFGACAQIAKSRSGLKGDVFNSIKEFFEQRASFFAAGDVVLLSPGGSSLDQYQNFEQRGNDFKSLVNRYIVKS